MTPTPAQARRLLAAAALAPALLLAGCKKKPPPRGQPATAVQVAKVQRIDAPITVTASGVVDPMQTVSVQAQVSGVLLSVDFREGQFVTPGQVLFRIDPRPLEAAVQQAQAALARDMAQAEAARRNDARYQALVRQDYVAREQADQIHAQAQAAAATVVADQAVLRGAQLNLGYATVRAPIAGRTGGLLARIGNVVGPSSGPLVVINQLQPIQVRFPILSQDLGLLQGAVARHPLPVTAVRSDSGMVTETGQLSFLDNAVDSLTGTVNGKAVFQNAQGRFWPGQLVFLTVQVGVQQGVMAIPTAAVLTGQQGSYVYVVDPATMKVQSRTLVTGRAVGDLTLVDRGLAVGEMVVTDGQSRLKPGGKVSIGGGRGGRGAGTGAADASGEASDDRQGGRVSTGGANGGPGGGGGASGGGGPGIGAGGTGGPAGADVGGARGGAGAPSAGASGGAGAGAASTGAAGAGARAGATGVPSAGSGGLVNGGATPAGGTRATTGGARAATGVTPASGGRAGGGVGGAGSGGTGGVGGTGGGAGGAGTAGTAGGAGGSPPPVLR